MTRRNMRILGALGVLFVLIAVVIGVFVPDDGKATPKERDAITSALTVTTVNVKCSEVVVAHGGSTVAENGQTLVVFNGRIGALKGTPPRLWSDALTVPYVQTEPVKMLGETQAETCFNPHYGVTVAHFFATMSVGDVKLVDLNPWLLPFAGEASQINQTAAGFIPLLDVTNPSEEQKQLAITRNIEWQRVAEKIGTLLTRFTLGDVRPDLSVRNYHLEAGGAVVGGLPAVGINTIQENLPALHLSLTLKDACVPLKVIGFNTGDKRPEEFAPPTCNPTVTPTPTTGSPRTPSNPTTTRSPSTTPPNGPTPTTTPPPTTVPQCSSGKCTPPTTVAPPPTTRPAPSTTAPLSNGGQGDSGNGATNTTTPPTTRAPAPAPPVTSSPTTNPPPPSG